MTLYLDPTETELLRTLLEAELDDKRIEVRRARNLDYKDALVAQESRLRRLMTRLDAARLAADEGPEGSAEGLEDERPESWAGSESRPGDLLG